MPMCSARANPRRLPFPSSILVSTIRWKNKSDNQTDIYIYRRNHCRMSSNVRLDQRLKSPRAAISPHLAGELSKRLFASPTEYERRKPLLGTHLLTVLLFYLHSRHSTLAGGKGATTRERDSGIPRFFPQFVVHTFAVFPCGARMRRPR